MTMDDTSQKKRDVQAWDRMIREARAIAQRDSATRDYQQRRQELSKHGYTLALLYAMKEWEHLPEEVREAFADFAERLERRGE